MPKLIVLGETAYSVIFRELKKGRLCFKSHHVYGCKPRTVLTDCLSVVNPTKRVNLLCSLSNIFYDHV